MDLFAKERLKAANFTAWGTPRRMALYVQGLEDRQEDLAEEIKGPPSKAAYDSEGRPQRRRRDLPAARELLWRNW